MAYKYEWRDSNGQKYLYIEADTRYELGRAYGEGNPEQITPLVDEFVEKQAKGDPVWLELCKAYEACIPEAYMDEIRGIRDGWVPATGREEITVSDMAIHTYAIDLSNKMRVKSLNGCTNFGVVNCDGSVTHGQNYDASLGMLEGANFTYHKLKGHPDMFVLRYGGGLGMATGKNEYGVCMTVSIVHTNQEAEVMTPRAVLVREALEKKTAREAIEAMAPGGKSSFSYNLVAADNTTVVASQAIPTEQRIVCVRDYIAQSNQFDYVDWQKYLVRPAYSKKRQFYAERQLADFRGRYGKVTDVDLIEILRDEPVICRTKIGDGIGTTVLFFTRESFGLGNPLKDPIGKQPI